MQISAKADYAVRALVELAGAGGGPLKGERLATSQDLPAKFLEGILARLRQQGIISSRRGSDGGYWLARPAGLITLADVIRATDGPLASVRGLRPEDVSYAGTAVRLSEVWLAVRASLRTVLEHVTIADVAVGPLPDVVSQMLRQPGARDTR